MKKLFVLSLLSLTLATTPSCKKYLDIRPYGKIIPKTPEEFASLLHDRLGAIDEARSEDWLLGNADRLADWDGGYGDDFETALFPTNLPVYLGDLVGTTRAYTPWTQLYQLIRDCNICIAGIPDSSTDKTGYGLCATWGSLLPAHPPLCSRSSGWEALRPTRSTPRDRGRYRGAPTA